MSTPGGGGGGHDFVRPFIMTGGRTRSHHLDLRIETLVRRIDGVPISATLASEKVDVVNACTTPTSVAEISASLHLVVGVVKVLIEDLVDSGHVEVFIDTENSLDADLDMLTRISNKIRSL